MLLMSCYFFFFFKQKTAYEMRISDWSSDVCSSDLALLKDHITIAVQLLQAAKDGDDAAFQQAHEDWYVNSDDIADFLAKANRRSWPQAAMRARKSVV